MVPRLDCKPNCIIVDGHFDTKSAGIFLVVHYLAYMSSMVFMCFNGQKSHSTSFPN